RTWRLSLALSREPRCLIAPLLQPSLDAPPPPPPPSSPYAVSSPRGLACTVASPAHARRAALAPARRVRHRLPDALHLRPPGQPEASPPRPTRHAPACYPTRPPVGPAVAAEFAPVVSGKGDKLGVVAVSGGDGGGCR
ncbi:unnamed protein product, partial [Closterium sp. NIES-53]